MDRKDIEQQITELKLEYVRVQDDMEKLVSLGKECTEQEAKLKEIEEQLEKYHLLDEGN